MATQKTSKEEIHELLIAAEQCKTDPSKYESIFKEINRKLPYGDKEVASVKHSIDATEIKVDYLSKRTKILYDLGDYEGSLECYRELYDLLPEHPKVLKGLGDCFRKLRKYEEAITQYSVALEILMDEENPSLEAHILNNKALTHMEMGHTADAILALEGAIRRDAQNALYHVTLGKVYNQEGKEKKALDSFVQASNLLNQPGSHFDVINIKYLKATLPHVIDLMEHKANMETAKQEEAKNAEEKKKQEKMKARAKEINDTINEVLSVNARRITTDNIITKSGVSLTTEMEITNRIIAENAEKVEVLKKETLQTNQDFESRLIDVEISVEELKIRMESFEEELNTKLDNFKKKIENEVADPALKKKLIEYYEGFTKTFDCICTTSLAIVSGQLPVNSGTLPGKMISTLLSFVDVLSFGSKIVDSVDDLLSSQEIRKNAIRMIHLGTGNDVGQTIGEAAYEIVLNEDYQKRIDKITDEDFKEYSKNWLGKLLNFVKEIQAKIDVKRHGELYPSPAAKLGNKDADMLVVKWLRGQVKDGNIPGDFKNQVIAQIKNNK